VTKSERASEKETEREMERWNEEAPSQSLPVPPSSLPPTHPGLTWSACMLTWR